MDLAEEKTIPENANQGCVGTESEEAGKAKSCEGCENQKFCLEKPKGPDPAIAEVEERMKDIKHKILVLSGKGGVGKSSFSVTTFNLFLVVFLTF